MLDRVAAVRSSNAKMASSSWCTRSKANEGITIIMRVFPASWGVESWRGVGVVWTFNDDSPPNKPPSSKKFNLKSIDGRNLKRTQKVGSQFKLSRHESYRPRFNPSSIGQLELGTRSRFSGSTLWKSLILRRFKFPRSSKIMYVVQPFAAALAAYLNCKWHIAWTLFDAA